MKWFLRACPACGGDLHEDIEDESLLTCFLCARTFAHDEAMPKNRCQGAQYLERRGAEAGCLALS